MCNSYPKPSAPNLTKLPQQSIQFSSSPERAGTSGSWEGNPILQEFEMETVICLWLQWDQNGLLCFPHL